MSDDDFMWYDERVEAFVDGELAHNEARLFTARLRDDGDLQRAVDAAVDLRQRLHDVPDFKCPRRVRRRIFEATGTAWKDRLGWQWTALVSSCVLALAVVIVPLMDSSPSNAELARARSELGVALAYLERASSMATHEARARWVSDGLVRPMSAGFEGLPGVRVEPLNTLETRG